MNRQPLNPLLCGVLVAMFALVSCKSSSFDPGMSDGGIPTEAGTIWPDTGGGGPCKPGQDLDMDQIPDDVEGCNRDTDNDMMPDYNDTDSDNDKVLDGVEAGINPKKPVDTDGDQTPDYRDTDSDNDKVNDGQEDLNGDGKLGCCLTKCGEQRTGCPNVAADKCGIGQQCNGGAGGNCTPPVAFLCANGESDPKKKTTFPGGKADDALPTFICHQSGEQGSSGLKPMNFRTNKDGQWKLALEQSSNYGDAKIQGAAAKEAGGFFDLQGNKQMVAGFVVSLPTAAGDVQDVFTDVMNKLNAMPDKAALAQLSTGSPTTSHDKFKAVVSSQLDLQTGPPKTVSAVRNTIMESLLGKQIDNKPADFGPSANKFRIMFQTLLRNDSRALVMGAVGTDQMANDPNMDTGLHMDDLSNGTGLANTSNSATVECDPFLLSSNPKADIIWVVDESGSMSDNRNDVANNAKDFFARAVASGLDFRIAVTGVNRNQAGRFCSVATTDRYHSGGTDRFLTPQEQSIFEACVKNPPGYEGGSEYGLQNGRDAVVNHLPRAPNDPGKIRTGATVVVIHATDEEDQAVKNSGLSMGSCPGTTSKKPQLMAHLQPDIDLFTGKSSHGADALSIVHIIGGVCPMTCSGVAVAHGYNLLATATQGTQSDICQKNLGQSMQIIINSITGASSPAKLQYVPISASIAVAVDKSKLNRSRISGFDYVSSSNTLVFIGVPFPKGSMVVASYRRWVQQKPIE